MPVNTQIGFLLEMHALSEMKVWDSNLTKESSLLLHAIHSPFYWRILKKTILYSSFKYTYKKICETKKIESIHE
jgi:hypothetical protein